MASIICVIGSGGVSIAPIMNADTIICFLILVRVLMLMIDRETSRNIIIGASKMIEKAKIVLITKLYSIPRE